MYICVYLKNLHALHVCFSKNKLDKSDKLETNKINIQEEEIRTGNYGDHVQDLKSVNSSGMSKSDPGQIPSEQPNQAAHS